MKDADTRKRFGSTKLMAVLATATHSPSKAKRRQWRAGATKVSSGPGIRIGSVGSPEYGAAGGITPSVEWCSAMRSVSCAVR